MGGVRRLGLLPLMAVVSAACGDDGSTSGAPRTTEGVPGDEAGENAARVVR